VKRNRNNTITPYHSRFDFPLIRALYIDLYWFILIYIDLYWFILIYIDLYWFISIYIDLHSMLFQNLLWIRPFK
jgi:hypothetical protein